MIGLTISATKSEVVLFLRKHLQLVVSIRVNGRLLPQSISFKYLGLFYDTGLTWDAQAKYVQKRCLQGLNFLKSTAGVWLGANYRCLLLLYKGLIGSVLDYASVCYSGMAKTHMLRLERVQYRGIRLALGLMCYTPNNKGSYRYTNSITTSKCLSPIATLCLTSRIVLSFQAAIIYTLIWLLFLPMLSKHPKRLIDSGFKGFKRFGTVILYFHTARHNSERCFGKAY
jgi:hypothetical protein